jgi:CBS domain containing-hemolysin-like protein
MASGARDLSRGAPIGVATVEDILEEVLGQLYDEDDDRAVIQLPAARGKVRGAELLQRSTRWTSPNT